MYACYESQAPLQSAVRSQSHDALHVDSFDNVTDDIDLKYFDDSVSHDVSIGIVPMIRAAQDAILKAGNQLTLFASPWSPPAWMKLPVDGYRSMLRTATPNGGVANLA
jgi:O-glycosyl hydrolase